MSEAQQHKSQIRLVAAVVIIAMLGWMAISWFGGKMGLPVRFAFLADLAALAAFAWAGIVLFRIRRARQSMKEE